MYQNIILEQKSHLAIITINRPDQLNALNKLTIEELNKALTQLNEDNSVGVIILTGSGEKSFVAGADIKEFADFSIAEGGMLAQNGQNIL
ncbi:MAG TPA: enoyl-CoA hydratase, partial [Crocinitomicaceae bacterium]|nr:enoyl-CoA hydratase [Crocinitomicaceae bacterium]